MVNICSENSWPIKAKFHVEPPWEVGKKVYINGTGHVTKMAAMLIYGINLQKSNRPRYQVSVYRTIGPLVSIQVQIRGFFSQSEYSCF